MVSSGIQAGNTEQAVGFFNLRQQRQIIMHDVAEGDPERCRRIAAQRRDDVTDVVIDIDGRLRLRITEHQNRKRQLRIRCFWIQGE